MAVRRKSAAARAPVRPKEPDLAPKVQQIEIDLADLSRGYESLAENQRSMAEDQKAMVSKIDAIAVSLQTALSQPRQGLSAMQLAGGVIAGATMLGALWTLVVIGVHSNTLDIRTKVAAIEKHHDDWEPQRRRLMRANEREAVRLAGKIEVLKGIIERNNREISELRARIVTPGS